ncbi:glutamate-5-semialdehyde dehydrogenase [Solihabitans fulvus]|uniref:glutamate-5-semialdehyde dehydrogenase n=1 Tax=Solihabitans fulvus TaxID=1892852 RepID=UPI001CB7622C|nr:glutamate-5-semialdehyde dehydrogenase [Solihabitans fulvus]
MTEQTIDDILAGAASARDDAPPPGDERYAAYCGELAARLTKHWDAVLAANATDVARARERGLPDSLLDRLGLAEAHLGTLTALAERTRVLLPEATAAGETRTGAGGITARKVAKALGVLLMIYEARPTVTVEGALLPVAVGNVAILRGGNEIAATNRALGAVITESLAAAGLPEGMATVLADTDRKLVRQLLARYDVIDALIPRGSPSLIDYCRTSSAIPVIASGGGVNHLYVDRSADLALAVEIALDSKLTEPTACNTVEMLLAHQDIAVELAESLLGRAEDFALRLDPALVDRVAASPRCQPLEAHDDGREFLDRTLGLRAVAGPAEAVAHIRRHGSRHTEGVVATDRAVADRFLRDVDAAALVVNGSMRLHDGPTMGLGPELSISTGRLHVRGPVGLSALLTHSWAIEGRGAIRGSGGER